MLSETQILRHLEKVLKKHKTTPTRDTIGNVPPVIEIRKDMKLADVPFVVFTPCGETFNLISQTEVATIPDDCGIVAPDLITYKKLY